MLWRCVELLKFRRKKNRLSIVIFILLVLLLAMLYIGSYSKNPEVSDLEEVEKIEIEILRTATGEVEILDLEEVILGVLAGEIPASVDNEALKAQAVAARSYILKKWQSAVEICDAPSCCQIYLDEEQRREKWGSNFEIYEDKLENVVSATAGEVMMKDGEIVDCFYCANCGGKTQSATSCWGGVEEYTSMECFWCTESASFQSTNFFTKEQLTKLLDVDYEALPMLKVSSVDATGRVKLVTCADESWTGSEFRTVLGLKSQQFSWLSTAEGYFFTVLGYGHGVGMCQDGAAKMAEAGYNYEEILEYYYNSCHLANFFAD